MTLIAEPLSRSEPAFRPRRRSAVWRFIKRHQLIELFVIIGGIVLAWLGAAYGTGQL
ncbi:MAG: hypothetical protein JJE37_15760 [Methyloceanibacter sp.]|jgi:hypothetical protein|nr:hypothetical protein [Methyloceanibacter sp.]